MKMKLQKIISRNDSLLLDEFYLFKRLWGSEYKINFFKVDNHFIKSCESIEQCFYWYLKYRVINIFVEFSEAFKIIESFHRKKVALKEIQASIDMQIKSMGAKEEVEDRKKIKKIERKIKNKTKLMIRSYIEIDDEYSSALGILEKVHCIFQSWRNYAEMLETIFPKHQLGYAFLAVKYFIQYEDEIAESVPSFYRKNCQSIEEIIDKLDGRKISINLFFLSLPSHNMEYDLGTLLLPRLVVDKESKIISLKTREKYRCHETILHSFFRKEETTKSEAIHLQNVRKNQYLKSIDKACFMMGEAIEKYTLQEGVLGTERGEVDLVHVALSVNTDEIMEEYVIRTLLKKLKQGMDCKIKPVKYVKKIVYDSLMGLQVYFILLLPKEKIPNIQEYWKIMIEKEIKGPCVIAIHSDVFIMDQKKNIKQNLSKAEWFIKEKLVDLCSLESDITLRIPSVKSFSMSQR